MGLPKIDHQKTHLHMSDIPPKLIGFPLSNKEWVLSVLRGLRNGIMCGARIRLPYVIQAIIYAIIFRDPGTTNKLRFVLKQMFHHGRNLGLFVFTYKTICFVLRNFGIRGGIECWIAGFIGGYWAFGESKGISGAVNNQIVLYLFARGIEGMAKSFVDRGILPPALDIRSPGGFRIFAGFSLALILYMTDYEDGRLKKGFMDTMNNLYYESNYESLLPPKNFAISVAVVLVSLFSFLSPSLELDNILSVIDRVGPHQPRRR